MARTAAEKPAPRISVLDRRLKNPFGSPSRDIPLQGEKRNWVVRTFCADAEHPNRHYDAVHRLGDARFGEEMGPEAPDLEQIELIDYDFKKYGSDVIEFDAALFADFAAVTAHAAQVGSDVVRQIESRLSFN